MTKKSGFLLALCAAMLFVFPLPAQNVQIDILPGFAGFYSSGNWVPVIVDIESDLPPFTGVLETSLPLGSSHLSERGSFSRLREVRIEPRTRVRLLLTLPVNRPEEVSLRLYREGELLSDKTFPLTPRGFEGEIILLLSRNANPGIPRGKGRLLLQIHPENLPGAPEGYASVSAVILHDAPLNEMSPVQVSALCEWVGNGGYLLATGGMESGERLPGPVADLLPLRTYGTEYSRTPPGLSSPSLPPLPQAASYPLNNGEASPDAQLIGEPPTALELLRNEGRGLVLATLLDPEAAPYREWEGREAYWEYLLSFGGGKNTVYPVSDPLPDTVSRLGDRLKTKTPCLPLKILPFLAPLLLLILIVLPKKTLPGTIPLLLLIPALTAAAVFLLFQPEKPVYREFALLRGKAGETWGELHLKGGLTGRDGGLRAIPLERENGIFLPDRNGDLIGNGPPGEEELLLLLRPWETGEFYFYSARRSLPETDMRQKGDTVSGFIRMENPPETSIVLNGRKGIGKALFLSEPGGLSFRINLSDQLTAERKTGGVSEVPEREQALSPVEKGFLDALAAGELITGEREADFHLLLFSSSEETYLRPESSEGTGIKAVLLDFYTEENR